MSTRDGGENVRDRQPVVGQGDKESRRATKRAGRAVQTAGYVAEADLANAEASLRAEVEAADAAALQAAIDAAAAQGTAEDALFEAQFGSIAVGRLQAGTINVAISLTSPSIFAGPVTLDSDGIRILAGTSLSSALRFRNSSGTNVARLSSTASGGVTLRAESSLALLAFGGDGLFTATGSLQLQGTALTFNNSTVRTFSNTSIPSGNRTSSGPSPDETSLIINDNGATYNGGFFVNHRHGLRGHTHTISI